VKNANGYTIQLKNFQTITNQIFLLHASNSSEK